MNWFTGKDTHIEITDSNMNSHNEKDDQHIVLKYFRLIDEKDMPGLEPVYWRLYDLWTV